MPETKKVVRLNDQRKLKIARGSRVNSSKVKNELTTWPNLKKLLSHCVRTPESYAEYIKWGDSKQGRVKQGEAKDVGYFIGGHMKGGRRKASNMSARSVLSLDADTAPVDFEEKLLTTLGGVEYLVYSTHKHNAEDPRIRIVIPLQRDVDVDEYEAISRLYCSHIGMDWFDSTTHQPSRAMHIPSASRDGDFYYFTNDAEKWADPDKALASYTNWRDVSQWPTGPDESKELRAKAKKAEDPLSKKGIIGAFCRAYTIHEAIEEFIPHVYERSDDESRYSYVDGSTANGATTYDDVFMFSHHGTDPCSSILVNAFDLVRIHLYLELDKKSREDTRPQSLPSYRALWDRLKDDDRVKAELLEDALPSFEVSDDEFDEDDSLEDVVLPKFSKKDAQQARENLKKRLTTDEHGKPDITLGNIIAILQEDLSYRDAIVFNEMTHDLVQIKDMPYSKYSGDRNGDLWSDSKSITVKLYLEINYKMIASKSLVDEALDYISKNSPYHPIKIILDSYKGLWKQGDESRIDTMLTRYLGCEDNAYTRAVSKKMMLAAVARVRVPGIKFDTMPVFEGKQGARKSTFVSVLAMGWFTDTLGDIARKDAAENLKGKWFVECAELEVTRKAEIEHMKAFFSRSVDRYRPAYERYSQDVPRQCIIVGTTNNDVYLKDTTGNRRTWPIKVTAGTIDTEALKDELPYLYAEADARWASGKEVLYLEDADVNSMAVETQKQRLDLPDCYGVIDEWLNSPITDGLEEFDIINPEFRKHVCVIQIWVEVLGGEVKTINNIKRSEIVACLKANPNWQSSGQPKRFGRYGVQKSYSRVADY